MSLLVGAKGARFDKNVLLLCLKKKRKVFSFGLNEILFIHRSVFVLPSFIFLTLAVKVFLLLQFCVIVIDANVCIEEKINENDYNNNRVFSPCMTLKSNGWL